MNLSITEPYLHLRSAASDDLAAEVSGKAKAKRLLPRHCLNVQELTAGLVRWLSSVLLRRRSQAWRVDKPPKLGSIIFAAQGARGRVVPVKGSSAVKTLDVILATHA